MRNKFFLSFIIIILLAGSVKTNPSDPLVDSLQSVLLEIQNPEKRIGIFLEIGDHIRSTSSPKEAENYIEKALIIAKNANNEKWIADVSVAKAKILTGMSDYEEAENILEAALLLYEEIEDYNNIIVVLNILGIIKRRQGDYIGAIHSLEKATSYFTDTTGIHYKAAVFTNLSNGYRRINKFSLAIEKVFEGIRLFEEVGDSIELGKAYGNLGLLYKTQGKYDLAIENYNKSLELLKERDLRGQANAYSNLATAYAAQGNYEKELEFQLKEFEVVQKMDSEERIFSAKIGIASSHMNFGNYSKAEEELNNINTDMTKIPDRYIMNYHLAYAELYYETQQYKKGIKEAEKAYSIANSQGDFGRKVRVLEILHHLHDAHGNYKKAYDYMTEYKMMSDSLSNESNLAELMTQKNKYEFEKNKIEFEKNKIEFEKNKIDFDLVRKDLENSLMLQRLFRWIAIFIALLIGLFAFISYIGYKKKNELLSEDLKNKEIIEMQAKELKEFNEELEERIAIRTKELKQANYELRTITYVASHDIKEPIRNVGNYVGLIYRKLPDDLKEKLGDYFEIIKRSTSQLYTLVEDFAKYTTMSQNEDKELQMVNLNSLVSLVEEGLGHVVQEYKGKIQKHNLPTIKSNNTLLYPTIKNLIENGLKYNRSLKPIVNISYKVTGTSHEITVSDNGIGIEQKYHENIFEMFKRLHNRGEYDGSGIGLAIVKLCSDKLGAKIQVESRVGEGSKFILSLPK